MCGEVRTDEEQCAGPLVTGISSSSSSESTILFLGFVLFSTTSLSSKSLVSSMSTSSVVLAGDSSCCSLGLPFRRKRLLPNPSDSRTCVTESSIFVDGTSNVLPTLNSWRIASKLKSDMVMGDVVAIRRDAARDFNQKRVALAR